MANIWGIAVGPVSLAYCCVTSAGVGPGRMKRSSTPDSATHCVAGPARVVSTSTNISAAFSLRWRFGCGFGVAVGGASRGACCAWHAARGAPDEAAQRCQSLSAAGCPLPATRTPKPHAPRAHPTHAAHQNAPTVSPGWWASMKGMEP